MQSHQNFVVSSFRDRLRAVVEHGRVQHAIIALSLLNAMLLGLETWPLAMTAAGGLIVTLDRLQKPVSGAIMSRRIETHLSLVRAQELENSQRAAIYRQPFRPRSGGLLGKDASDISRHQASWETKGSG